MDLDIEVGSLGGGYCPASWQALADNLAAAMNAVLPSTLAGIVKSASTPSVGDQDKIWIKLDGTGKIENFYIYVAGVWEVWLIRQMACFQHTTASPTDGGTFTSGAWQTRVVNTTQFNNITGASLAANQITLPAGTYEVTASGAANSCSQHVLALYNVTDAAHTMYGSSAYSAAGNPSTNSVIMGRFTIASTKVFELRHRCAVTVATTGYGYDSTFSITNIFAQVAFQKVA